MEKEIRPEKRRTQGPHSDPPDQPTGLALGPHELRFSGRSDGLLRLQQWVGENEISALRLSLEEAARIACLEPCHLSKTFHKRVGMRFKEWRRQYRIAWAAMAIESGTLTLGEVIQLSRYRDRRAFERAVKRLTGKTPGCIWRGRENTPRGKTESQVKPQASQVEPQPVLSSRETIRDSQGTEGDSGMAAP